VGAGAGAGAQSISIEATGPAARVIAGVQYLVALVLLIAVAAAAAVAAALSVVVAVARSVPAEMMTILSVIPTEKMSLHMPRIKGMPVHKNVFLCRPFLLSINPEMSLVCIQSGMVKLVKLSWSVLEYNWNY
jgi:hypothetical protein